MSEPSLDVGPFMEQVLAATSQLPRPYKLVSPFWDIRQNEIELLAFGGNISRLVPLPIENPELLLKEIIAFIHEVGEIALCGDDEELIHNHLLFLDENNAVQLSSAVKRHLAA